MMELLSWSLNAIDKVFSTRRLGTGEPACPDGTFLAGYTLDGWDKWRVVCLGVLDIEDVEDVYLFAFMMMGLLSLGAGVFLTHRMLKKIRAGNTEDKETLAELRQDIGKTRGEVKEALAILRVNILKIREELGKARQAIADED